MARERSARLSLSSMPQDIDIDFSQAWSHSDIVFDVEDKEVYASKMILSMWSPVFKAMFSDDFREKSADHVELPGKSHEHVMRLFAVVHPPNADIEEESVEGILSLAEEYQMEMVTKKCENFLLSMPPDIKNYEVAKRFGLERLKTGMLEFLKEKSVKDLKMMSGWTEFDGEAKVELLDDACMKLADKVDSLQPFVEKCSKMDIKVKGLHEIYARIFQLHPANKNLTLEALDSTAMVSGIIQKWEELVAKSSGKQPDSVVQKIKALELRAEQCARLEACFTGVYNIYQLLQRKPVDKNTFVNKCSNCSAKDPKQQCMPCLVASAVKECEQFVEKSSKLVEMSTKVESCAGMSQAISPAAGDNNNKQMSLAERRQMKCTKLETTILCEECQRSAKRSECVSPTVKLNITKSPCLHDTSEDNDKSTTPLRRLLPLMSPKRSPDKKALTSPNNRPTSPINRPTSPLNRPTSPINRPTSPINRPTSPINRPTSPIKNYL